MDIVKPETNIETTVLEIVMKLSKIDTTDITLDSRLKNDLGFDSVNAFDLCVDIENALKVSIDSEISNIKTVGDIVTIVRQMS